MQIERFHVSKHQVCYLAYRLSGGLRWKKNVWYYENGEVRLHQTHMCTVFPNQSITR